MRCLALAQAAQDEGHSTAFAMAKDMNGLVERIKNNNCTVVELKSLRGSPEDAKETSEITKKLNTHLIVDGYAFADEYQKTLKQNGVKFLLVDDYGQATEYSADIILNQNSYAESLRDIYTKRSGGCELLLGSEYVMLRREFRELESHPVIPERAESVLVTLGGSDPDNVTMKVVNLLGQIENIEVTVVVGVMNPYLNDIKTSAENMNVLTDVKDMPSLIAKADLAITAGGSTTYEMAYMGIPTAAFVIANNQETIVSDLDNRGFLHSLGRPEECSDDDFLASISGLISDQSRRQKMSEIGRKLIDGKGTKRIIDAFLTA